MKTLSFTLLTAGLMALNASASTVTYNTTGSTLSCNGVSGCVQNASGVTIGGITLTYNVGTSGGLVSTPSFINLGNIVSTGTGSNVSFAGVQLVIKVNSTPNGGSTASGNIVVGTVSGTLSTGNSSASITWSSLNTTTSFGNLPGVVIGNQVYQVAQTFLSLQAPTIGNPAGQTSIQGAVADLTTPEPATMVLMGLGLGVAGLLGRRKTG